MRNLILILSIFVWTQVQAQGQYNSHDRDYEMTYDDLAQELSLKKKTATDTPTQALGFDRIQAIFGYSFSDMELNLASGGSAFSMNGIDVRMNGKITDSNWQLEGGFKNYSRISSGEKSAEARILTTSLKNQNYLNANIQYVAGVSTSLHWINAHDLMGTKNEMDLSLNVTAGLRGPLSSHLSWGVDLNAYSPISGKVLKGGVEATVLLSSLL
jgi:hypothetical protein